MAGHEETGSKANGAPGSEPLTPFGTPSPLHREPPLIEGQLIEDKTIEDKTRATAGQGGSEKPEAAKPENAGAEEPLAEVKLAMEELLASGDEAADREKTESAATPPAAAAAPPAQEAAAHEEEPPRANPPPAAAPKRQGLSFAAVLIVAIIGAITGFASATVTRLFLDDSQPAAAALGQRLMDLNSKLAADEKKIDTLTTNGRDGLSALEKRLGTVEKSASEALGLAKTAQSGGQTAAGSEASSSEAAPNAPPPDLAPLQTRIDALEQQLAQVEAALNTPKTVLRAPQEPDSKQDPQQANAPAIAIIAGNLVQKIASGAPFATEIAALDKLGADKTKLAALQPAAAKGIVTTRALSEQFSALVPSLLAGEKPAAQEGFFEKLKDHAASLVRIRRLDDLSGDDLAARIARTQAALAHDDLDRALQEWASFPAAAKSASAQWAEAAKARAGTLATAKAIEAEAMTNLAKVKS
jgi:hypothetical protein